MISNVCGNVRWIPFVSINDSLKVHYHRINFQNTAGTLTERVKVKCGPPLCGTMSQLLQNGVLPVQTRYTSLHPPIPFALSQKQYRLHWDGIPEDRTGREFVKTVGVWQPARRQPKNRRVLCLYARFTTHEGRDDRGTVLAPAKEQ